MSYRIVDNMFGGPSAWPGMGSLLSYFVGGISNRNMDVPCSTTGLTPREKEAVRVTWELVKQDLKGVGIELLKSFFVANPTYQQYFKAFKDVPLDDLPGNSRFQAHSMSVMYALCSVVEHLDDPTVLVEMLHKLGESHGKRNIKPKHFQDLKVVLMKLLKTKLGSNFSEEEEKAWERTINVAYSIILPALEKDAS